MKTLIKTIIIITFLSSKLTAQIVNSTKININNESNLDFGQNMVNLGQITNHGEMHFKQDLSNFQNIYSPGLVVIDGNASQSFAGTSEIKLSKLKIFNDLNLKNNLSIIDKIEFSKGIVNVLGASILELQSNATYAGFSDISHVNGYMRKLGSKSFEFPIGDGTKMKSFTVKNTANTTMEAMYISNNPMSISSDVDAALTKINQNEYWIINSSDDDINSEIILKDKQVAFLKNGVWTNQKFNSSLGGGMMFTSNAASDAIPKEIGAWPNPVTAGNFNLKLSGLPENDFITVDVMNDTGNVLMKISGTVKELRKSYTLPKGASNNILLRLVDGDEAMTQKLVSVD